MSLEGEIVVRLAWDGHRVQQARVASTRPLEAARVLIGKTPAEAVATVPLLFSICSGAQRAAAAHALASAGASVDASTATDVVLEIVQEHFWRLLLDWPQTMGHGSDAASVAHVRRKIAARRNAGDRSTRDESRPPMHELVDALNTTAAQTIYGMLPAAWHALRDADDLWAWVDAGATMPARLLGVLFDTMPQLARSDVALMPLPDREALMRAIVPALDRQPEFSRAPTWEGSPVETGALARMRSHPLVAAAAARDGNSVATRMVARLAELATLLQDLADASVDERPASWVHSLTLVPGEGLGAVQTARGLLLHRVRLADGRVAHYQIIAPTEWNFHPEGALVCGLRGLVTDDGAVLDRSARLAVQALDPCVACTIEIGHA